MFFFKKKEVDLAAAKSFWDWYAQNEGMLVEKLMAKDMELVYLIDSHLSPVFPYCKSLEFELGGYIEGHYEFLFYHCGNKNLKRDGLILKNMMPPELSDHILFDIKK